MNIRKVTVKTIATASAFVNLAGLLPAYAFDYPPTALTEESSRRSEYKLKRILKNGELLVLLKEEKEKYKRQMGSEIFDNLTDPHNERLHTYPLMLYVYLNLINNFFETYPNIKNKVISKGLLGKIESLPGTLYNQDEKASYDNFNEFFDWFRGRHSYVNRFPHICRSVYNLYAHKIAKRLFSILLNNDILFDVDDRETEFIKKFIREGGYREDYEGIFIIFVLTLLQDESEIDKNIMFFYRIVEVLELADSMSWQ